MVRACLAWWLAVVQLVTGCSAMRVSPDDDPDLRTVAEKSDWKATARHEDVVALLDALAASNPKAKRLSMGKTEEGREIPLLVLADPPVSSAKEATEAVRRGRLVVLLLGNIHAGEVDGKEALPMLAREILAEPDSPLLKDLVVAVAPIFNADGNERVAKDNRPGQVGPDEGMGIRENANGLDLNRDFIKLETAEARALVSFANAWDPAVIVDCHTTNGSHHRYTLTYAGPRSPSGDPRVLEFVRDQMLPRISADLLARTGIPTFPYGDFDREHTTWSGYPAHARYLTTYFGLRNRITVLSEGYSYAPYKDRVIATLEFCRQILMDSSAHKAEIKKLIADANSNATEKGKSQAEGDVVSIRSRAAKAPEKVIAHGYVEEERDGRWIATEEHKDYEVELWDRFESAMDVPRPFAYVLRRGPEGDRATEMLRRHGVQVDEIREDIELEAEAFAIESFMTAEREFQKHRTATVEASRVPRSERIEAGARLVRIGQPLGNLAVYLLEPACEDGLATWNVFDESLSAGSYPVLALPRSTPILSSRLKTWSDEPPAKKKLTFELLYESDDAPNFSGSPTSVSWLDETHFTQRKDGKAWKVDAASGRAEALFDPAPIAEALSKLPTLDGRARELADGSWGLQRTEDNSAAIAEHANDLYWFRLDGTDARRLTSTPEDEEFASPSPDGRYVAFVRDNDLYVVDTPTGTERRLTTGGTDLVRNGKNDWVYFEELYGRSWGAFWWSPDSTRLAFLQVDSTPVSRFVITDNRERAQTVENAPFPKPGTPNPRVRLGLVTAAGGSTRWADLSAYNPEDFLISGVAWQPDSSGVVFYGQNRVQSWMDVNAVGRDGGAVKRLFRETTQAWVEALGAPDFLDDGSFLFQSERTGWRHLYHYSKDGKLIRPITAGEWEVRGVERLDPEWVYVVGTKDSHIASNLYRVALHAAEGAGDAPSEPERLTHEPGSHSISMPEKGDFYVDSWSSAAHPTRVVLRNLSGAAVRTLDTNPVPALDEHELGTFELLEIPGPDGTSFQGAICKPADFDPGKKYPVWFQTYAGPHSPTISDSWAGGRAWDHMLAASGVIVFRADPGPASGRGAISAWRSYKQLGVPELADIKTIITWLKGHEWVDGERVGMNGHSFGGYITAYAMTHSDLFAAGIAGAPVTDWRDYDSIYTERYMLTPQDNPDGYDSTSAVGGASKLHGRLLLLHGAIDDNVHIQNSERLVRALQDANKPFEIMMYPGMRHGLFGKHYQRTMYEFIQGSVNAARPNAAPTPANQEDGS